MRSVVPLTHRQPIPAVLFRVDARWWTLSGTGFLGAMALEPGEAERRFGRWFDIDPIAREVDYRKWPPATPST